MSKTDETAEWRNGYDEQWGGPNPSTCDDRVWWEATGMCGGCGDDGCHEGPCGAVESWHYLLVCDRCPTRVAQGLVTAALTSPPNPTTVKEPR